MKKLIIGLVIGLMLGMSTNAFAAIGDTVSAVFAQFNYVVNGTAKTINSPVLVYEGVSYVRTTDISNMLGYDVTYKADSRTIEFNNPAAVPAPSSTPTPTGSPTPTTAPTGSPAPDPSASPTPSSAPTATPAPTPTANYSGYNAACASLDSAVAAANNQLYLNWVHAYQQYQGTATAQVAYDIMQYNIAANNTQLALDKQALKSQYNIP